MKKNLILTSLVAMATSAAANAASYTGADLTFGGEAVAYETGSEVYNDKDVIIGVTVAPVEYQYKTWDSEAKKYVVAEEPASTSAVYAANYSYTNDLFVENTDGSLREKTAKDTEFTGTINKTQTQNEVSVESNNKIFANANSYEFDGNVSSNIINKNDYYATLGSNKVNLAAEEFNNATTIDLFGEGDTSFAKMNKDEAFADYIANVKVNGGTKVVSERGELNRELKVSDVTLKATNGNTYGYDADDNLIDIATGQVATPGSVLQVEIDALDAAIEYMFDAAGSIANAKAETELDPDEAKVYGALEAAYEADKAAMDAKSDLFGSYKETMSVYKSNESSKKAAEAKLASNEKNAVEIAKANEALENASILDVINDEATAVADAAANRALTEAKAYADAGDARTLAAANAYTDSKVNALEENISGGVASAVALSSVAVSNVAKGEVSVGAGYGYYNSQSAAAFGAAMGLTDRWSVNAGAGIATGNKTQVSFRAGTNYKFKLF